MIPKQCVVTIYKIKFFVVVSALNACDISKSRCSDGSSVSTFIISRRHSDIQHSLWGIDAKIYQYNKSNKTEYGSLYA